MLKLDHVVARGSEQVVGNFEPSSQVIVDEIGRKVFVPPAIVDKV